MFDRMIAANLQGDIPERECGNESIFDRFVRGRCLPPEQIDRFMQYIAGRYTGPLYTRQLDEVERWWRDFAKN